MKYTVFTPCEPSFFNAFSTLCVLEGCINLNNEGKQVNIIDCDGKIPFGCCYNRLHNKWVCRACQRYKKVLFKQLPKDIRIIPLSKYAPNIVGNYQFDYNTSNEIKKYEYRGVEIGYSCLSTYISISRNLYPLIDEASRPFFDLLMRQACQYTDMVYAVINDMHPDVLGCWNNRLVYSRPVVCIAKNLKIDFFEFERWHRKNGEESVAKYDNVEVHDLEYHRQLMNEIWNDDVPIAEKKSTAEQFFYKRRNSIYSGDKLYVKDQVLGTLPQQWNEKEQNIVIFNSSEDEFASLGKEYEKNKAANLFFTQYQGLKYIAGKYRNCENLHFYLRVHPNLKKVNYSYHNKLYELNTDNFTVIPADSQISTYSLIDVADKVIVFGSTTGLEAAYWGKPVILLANCIYKKLDFCYLPANLEELNELILAPSLESKKNDGVFKCPYFLLNDYYPAYKVFHHSVKRISFFKHNFEVFLCDINLFQRLLLIVIQIIGKWHLSPTFHDYPKKEDPNAEL